MTSTQFFPMSLPMILSSGNKGDRWGLCFVDSSWSPSSSSNLSLGNPSRASDWNWGLQAFSWEHGGVRKTDDGEVSNEGVMRPVLMRLRSWSPGDSGVKKQLGSSGWLLFFLWCLSVCSMATLNYGRSAAESKITFVSRSLLCVDDWRLVKTFWFNRQIANTMWQPITASYFFSRQNSIFESETAALVRPSLDPFLARPKASPNMKNFHCFPLTYKGNNNYVSVRSKAENDRTAEHISESLLRSLFTFFLIYVRHCAAGRHCKHVKSLKLSNWWKFLPLWV